MRRIGLDALVPDHIHNCLRRGDGGGALVEVLDAAAGGDRAIGQDDGARALATLGALTAAQRAAEQERFTQAWLRLQQEVNALIDSTTAENSDTPVRRRRFF